MTRRHGCPKPMMPAWGCVPGQIKLKGERPLDWVMDNRPLELPGPGSFPRFSTGPGLSY